jgi:hypothetical protein
MVFSFFCVLYRAGHGLEHVVALLQHKKSAPGFVGSRDVVPLKNVQSLLLGDNAGQLVTPALGPKYLWTENFIFRLTRKMQRTRYRRAKQYSLQFFIVDAH